MIDHVSRVKISVASYLNEGSPAILDGDQLHVFAVNRSLRERAPVVITVNDRKVKGLVDGEVLTGPGPQAANSFEQPDVLNPTPVRDVKVVAGRARLTLPPLSVLAVTLRLQ